MSESTPSYYSGRDTIGKQERLASMLIERTIWIWRESDESETMFIKANGFWWDLAYDGIEEAVSIWQEVQTNRHV